MTEKNFLERAIDKDFEELDKNRMPYSVQNNKMKAWQIGILSVLLLSTVIAILFSLINVLK